MSFEMLWGKYWPANSFWHRRDPRAILGVVILLLGFILSVSQLDRQAVILVLIILIYKSARFPLTAMIENTRPIYGFLLFIFVINLLVPFPVRWENLSNWEPASRISLSLFITLRFLNIWLISLWMMMIVRITSLINGLCHLLRPLNCWIPVHEIALAMGVAIRFLPLLAEEGEEILLAQKARALGQRQGLSRGVLIIIPLMVGVMRRAKEMAEAIDARGYRPGSPPTIWPPTYWSIHETVVFGITVVLVIVAGLFWGWV